MAIQPFTLNDINGLHETAQSSLLDTCEVFDYVTTYNDIGEPIADYESVGVFPCGFSYSPNQTRETRGELPNLEYDARLRLLPDTPIDYQSRVTITHKMGVEVESPA